MTKIVSKGKVVRLCKGLTSKEFQCKCKYEACRSSLISPELIKAFASFRKLVNVKLAVNSGFRCSQHNFDVGGKPCSRHLTGQAIDVSLKSLNHLENPDIEFAAKDSGFTFVLFYKTFVHLDVR